MSALLPSTGVIESRDIFVRAFPNPLRDEFQDALVPAGQTVLEIVGRADLPAVIIADGRVIECEEWSTVVPLETLDIRRIPAGGDTGRIIGSIAILALAVWGGPAFAAWAGGMAMMSAGMTAFVGAAASVTIGIAGNLLLNALIPPPSAPGVGAGPQPLGWLTSQSNQVGQFSPIPNLYGTFRFYPPVPMTGLPYTELVGRDQYFRAIYVLGYGPLQIAGRSTSAGLITHQSSPSVMSAIRIADTTIDNFEDFEFQIGNPDDVTLYTSTIVEEAVNVSMPLTATPTSGNWVLDSDDYIRTTEPDTDEISIDLFAPALYSQNENTGSIRGAAVRFDIAVRLADTSPLGSWTTLEGDWTIENSNREPVRVGKRFVLPSKGTWQVKVTRDATRIGKTDAYESDFVWTVLRSIKRNVRPFDVPNVVVMAIRIRATDQLGGRLERLSVEATRILPVWSTSVSPHAWVNTATRNPAWAYVDVLTGNATRNALSKSRINTTAIKAWADWCATEGLYCDMLVDSQGTVFDRARDVASTGLASWHIEDDGSISVVRDVVANSVALISPRIISEFGHEYSYPDVPHCLRVQFIDPDRWEPTERLVYDDDYDPTASPHTTATRFEQLQLIGVTDADQAWKIGRFHLAQLRLRPEQYSWKQDIGHLVYTRGDCVDLQHDVILVGLRAGRIKSISGQTAEVDEYLPMSVTSPLTTYGLRIQKQDGSIVTRTITTVAPGTTSVTIAGSVDGIQAGDHFIFGISGAETIKAKITRIEPMGNFQARVVAVPAADNIYDAWTGSIPAFDPVITAPVDQSRSPPVTPEIVSFTARTDTAVPGSDGARRTDLRVAFSTPVGQVGVMIESRYYQVLTTTETSPQGTYTSQYFRGPTVASDDAFFIIPDVEENATYYVQIRATRGGVASPWTSWSSLAISALGMPPSIPYNLGLKINANASGATNAGEFALFGYTNGIADYTKDGTILWNGEAVTVPRDAGDGFTGTAGGSGTRTGFIVFDTSKPGTPRFTANAQARHVVFAYQDGGTWYYDTNSGSTTFTPIAGRDVALGWLSIAGDNITAGGLFGDPMDLSIAAEPLATYGAQFGANIRDESGDILADLDVRNDLIVSAALGAINANPGFEIPRQHSNGTTVPSSWFSQNGADAIQYVTGARDELFFSTTSTRIDSNAAFRVEPRTSYEVVVLARKTVSGDSTTLRVLANEYDSELTSGQRAICASASVTGAGADPSSVFAVRTRNVTLLGAQALTTTYAVYSAFYTPTSTAKWCSISIDPQDNGSATGNMRVEWVVVRERATRNTGVLADLDEVDTPEIVDNAVTSVTQAFTTGSSGAIADYSSYTTIQTATFTATGATVNIHASALFNCLTPGGASGVYVRLRKTSTSPHQTLWTSGTSEFFYVPEGGRLVVAFNVVDTPAAGTVTYELQACTYSSGAYENEALNRALICTETKK